MAESETEHPSNEQETTILQRFSRIIQDRKYYFVFPVLALVFFLPFQWAVNGVADWFRDHHILYNPQKEGLISVASPQLFTRERLINQRLSESDWIDGRIEAIGKMIDEGRFREMDASITTRSFLKSDDTAASQDGQNESSAKAPGSATKISPMDEFKAANEYRQYLVREKFQSILDDAHDTSSNTLQRLNFNLTISPARHHSRALAAVSITLEEPKDPEWILQKYGELLLDVREELQQTANKMIADRSSVFKPDERYLLPGETEAILRAEIEKKAIARPHHLPADLHVLLSDLKLALDYEFTGAMIQAFRDQLTETGLDPSIETALDALFFARRRPLQKPAFNELWTAHGTIRHNLAGLASNQSSAGQGSPVNDLLQKLKSTCPSGVTNIWELLPGGYSSSNGFQDLERKYAQYFYASSERETHGVFPSSDAANLALRKTLADQTIRVPCPPRLEQVAHMAMLQVLGDLSLAGGQKGLRESACTPQNFLLMNVFRKFEAHRELAGLRQVFPSEGDFFRHCSLYWFALRNIGVVHLVQAELNQTPIDTAGRLRSLDDYFEISTYDCDLHSCQIVVRTKSEHYRKTENAKLLVGKTPEPKHFRDWNLTIGDGATKLEPLLEARDEGVTIHASPETNGGFTITQNANLTNRKARLIQIEKNALEIGRQEALRLFAELSCYASARSYTVYPLEGLGETTLEQRNNSWSLPVLFGQSNSSASYQSDAARVSRTAKILGIGDTGSRMEETQQVKECSATFLSILNNLEADKFSGNELTEVTQQLFAILKTPNDKIDEFWRQHAICVLNHFVEEGTESTPTKASLTACKQKLNKDGARRAGQIKRETIPDDGVETPSKPGEDLALKEFDLLHLTAAVRYLRQRKTTISWLVHPDNTLVFVSRHTPRNIPLSAIVSLPSWWPGVQMTTETCWLRPKQAHVMSGRTLCPETHQPEWFGIKLSEQPSKKTTARVEARQIMPLPFSLEDVLPKLGFFLVRYPYIDRVNPDDIELESGREVQLRLTGKRLWKNPRVRIGEQWNTRVEVLPDMEGILATFDCLEPLPADHRTQTIQGARGLVNLTSSTQTGSPDKYIGGMRGRDAYPLNKNEMRDQVFSQQRPVQVWTSEGKTQHVAVTVNAFRPRHIVDGQLEAPCWAKQDLTNAVEQRLKLGGASTANQ